MAPTKRKSNGKGAQLKALDEGPEELELWRRVIQDVDHLKALIRTHELGERAEQSIGTAAMQAYRNHHRLTPSDFERAVGATARRAQRETEAARTELSEFLAAIRKLRAGKSGTYALGKLKKLVLAPQNKGIESAFRSIAKHLANPTDAALKLNATNALISARRWMTGDETSPVDLPALDADARAWCNKPNSRDAKSRHETPTTRAKHIVAAVCGMSIDAEPLRSFRL